MSILLKALRQAEADRQAARIARHGAGTRADAEVPAATPDRIEIGITPVEMLVAKPGRNAPPPPAYGGLWITLALAVVSAAGFGYWMRGVSLMNSPPAPSLTNQAGTSIPASATGQDLPVATGRIPTALNVQEAGPLQLRLDRQFDKLGAHAR